MKEIKPCPFCGGKGGIMFGGVNSVWVNCQQCDADGPWVDNNEDDAIDKWNTRIQKDMKVYVVLEQTSYSDYEFCGVHGTREQAQKRLNEVVKEIPRQKDNLYIEEYEMEIVG